LKIESPRSDNRKKTKVFRIIKISQTKSQLNFQTHEVTIEIKLKSELEKYPKLNLTLTSEEIGRKLIQSLSFSLKFLSKGGRCKKFFVHLFNISSIENEIKRFKDNVYSHFHK